MGAESGAVGRVVRGLINADEADFAAMKQEAS